MKYLPILSGVLLMFAHPCMADMLINLPMSPAALYTFMPFDKEHTQRIVCQIVGEKNCPMQLPVVQTKEGDAILDTYDTNAKTAVGLNNHSIIYVRRWARFTSCFGLKYLAHEDMHTVQNAHGLKGTKQREEQAYKVQDIFLSQCMEVRYYDK